MSANRAAAVWAIAVAVCLASSVALAAAGAQLDDKNIKLSGCLVRGENGGYLLTNVPGEPVWQRTSEGVVLPDAVGTTGAFATVFFWLNDDDDLKPHVGHLVEVEGDLKERIEDGAIRIERKDNWTEITIKSNGRDLRARLPRASILSEPSRDERALDVLVRQVDVERVRMLRADCRR